MTQVVDRVREVSTSSSTGPMTLQGTVVGFRRFRDAVTDGATVPYVIENGAEWEVGYGTFTAPATLYRDTVKASSNGNAKVDFSLGQKSVWVDAIADYLNSNVVPVSSVNGYTGVVVLTKSDVGLGNCDNTSDANKPVSTATQAALDLKVNTSTLGAVNGVATLDSGGTLTSSQIPAIAVVDYLGSVANQAAMLALTGQKGDWCIRTDLSTTWVITGSTPSSLSSWTQLSYPTAPVTSVNGYTGAVSLSKSDVGLANVDNTSDANKPISTATQTALNAKQATITVNGIVKGNGAGTLSAAVAGTDYAGITSANTFTNNQVISTSSSSDALRITQTGAGNALVVEDSANPDATPFVIDASGRVGIGTAPLYAVDGLSIASSGSFAPQVFVRSSSNDGSASYLNFEKVRSTAIVQNGDDLGAVAFRGFDGAQQINAAWIYAEVDGTPGTNDMPGRLVFSTTADGASSPTERMRIDSAGRVGVGSGANADTLLTLAGTYPSAGSATFAQQINGTIPSATTNLVSGYRARVSTQAAAFNLATIRIFDSGQGSIGSGSSITTQYGYYADPSLTGATNNYGFYSNIASGTGRYNFYAAGTADNYFAGNTTIAGTTTLNASLNGLAKLTSGVVSATTATLSVLTNAGTTVQVSLNLS